MSRIATTGDDGTRIGIDKILLERVSPDQHVDGHTVSGSSARGVATMWNLRGVPGVDLQIADVCFESDERDVRVLRADGPLPLGIGGPRPINRLQLGLRLSVLRHRDTLCYSELQLARVNMADPRMWSSVFKATHEDLSAVSNSTDPVELLMALGASSIGPRSTTLGDSGPRRNQMAVVFDEGATLVPVAAYVVTRVMPLLNLWSPIHRRPDEVGRHRRVYVVELSDEAGERAHGGCPNLYVGETARTPEDRFQTHLTGGRTASRVVRRHGRWLRPDLYEHIPPVGSKEQSAEVEGWLKQELERLGHRVWGGTRGIHEAPFARAPGPTSNES